MFESFTGVSMISSSTYHPTAHATHTACSIVVHSAPGIGARCQHSQTNSGGLPGFFSLVVKCGPLHQLNLQSSKPQTPIFCWLQLFQPLAGNPASCWKSSTWIWLINGVYAIAWSYNVVVCMQSVWYFCLFLVQWLFSIILPLRQIQRLVHGVPC